MRTLALVAAGSAIAGCTTAPPQPTRTAEKQAEYVRLTEGLVAGQPLSCMPYAGSTNDMRVIDDNTVLFVRGRQADVEMRLSDGCSSLGLPGYAMLTRQNGQLCRGDIVQVMQTSVGMSFGSCVVEGFTAFRKP